jgi:hypothetical protein
MLTTSFKLALVIGSMRWHLLQFADPIVAYSDHPVVAWPMAAATATPFPKPELAPMAAIEIRAPLSSRLALLMTWVDKSDDQQPVAARRQHAAELNAFTISQAERQWMHQPGTVPPGRHRGGLAPAPGGRALSAPGPQEAIPVRHRARGRGRLDDPNAARATPLTRRTSRDADGRSSPRTSARTRRPGESRVRTATSSTRRSCCRPQPRAEVTVWRRHGPGEPVHQGRLSTAIASFAMCPSRRPPRLEPAVDRPGEAP